jgi:TonB family protein
VDSVTAARQAFGNLEKLQETLRDYVRSDLRRTRPMEVTAPIEIDEASYASRELSRADSLAMRASFLAAGDNREAAWPLLEGALRLDPVNALAHETKGFLYFFQQDSEEALRWFTRAVELDSQSYIAHYYFAVLATEKVENGDAWSKAERSLRRAIAINPMFGPGYGQLAYEYLRRDQNLEGALDIARRAVTLEPDNVTYLFNLGHILLRLSRYEEALAIGERLSAIATTDDERALAAAYRDNVDSYRPSGPRLASTVHYDAKGADIQPWVQGFTEAARRHWSVPPSEAYSVGHVAIEISIRRSGEIVGLRIQDSSGIPALERAAEEALRQALSSPVPSLPDDYPGEIFELVVVFWYNEEPYDRT